MVREHPLCDKPAEPAEPASRLETMFVTFLLQADIVLICRAMLHWRIGRLFKIPKGQELRGLKIALRSWRSWLRITAV